MGGWIVFVVRRASFFVFFWVKKLGSAWMDGWMVDGWRWVIGWMDGWMGGWIDGRMGRWMEVNAPF